MPLVSIRLKLLLLIAVLGLTAGCERAEPLQWESSQLVKDLPDQLPQAVEKYVRKRAGTASRPQLLSKGTPDFEFSLHLKHGQAVYMRRCVQCHGVTGNGDGPVAASLYPRPRDYTRGIFKFTSTPYGGKPRREDLLNTLKRGVTGTSMPEFRLLPKKDLEAVIDYVIVLAQRGEFEYQLAMEAEFAVEELVPEVSEDQSESSAAAEDGQEPEDPPVVVDSVELVSDRWNEAESSLTQPLSPEPELTAERVALGREAFLTKGCSKCHGEDGRGHTKDNIGNDSWGHPTRAADLTSGMLRGGQEPIDVYRRILNGINGSPMPGFKSSLQSEPETIWNLVSYVLDVSGRRRGGSAIPAGLIKPYVSSATDAAADDPDSGAQ